MYRVACELQDDCRVLVQGSAVATMKMEYYIYNIYMIYGVPGQSVSNALPSWPKTTTKLLWAERKIYGVYGGQFARFFSKCIVVIFAASVKLFCASQESDEKP